MAVFSYVALDAQGQESRGVVDAHDLADARSRVRGLGLRVLELAAGDGAGAAGWRQILSGALRSLGYLLPVGLRDLQMLFRQMQLMLRSGHTILETLQASAKLTSKPRLGDALSRIAARIQRGTSFSAACSEERAFFPRVAVKLIEAGEASGELDMVFERLSSMLERRAEVRRQLTTALVYPGIVVLAATGVIYYLVSSVVPRFAQFLNARGKAVPWAAQTMMDMADLLQRWGGVVGGGLVVLVVSLLILHRIPGPRLVLDRILLALPVVGGALTFASMAQGTWILGMLIKSRLTALEGIRVVADVMGNARFAAAFRAAAEQVLVGKSLAIALEQPALPRLVRHMVAIGERSGQMDTVLEALGTHYQRELDGRVKLLSSLIEPVLTLLVGSIVGFVYYAFFQAVLAVSTGGG
ncbi:type II secretion system F family protein [Zoogloea sp.]|uniref:type II secretion system F family protein n=1 Tax=Zoogloea sp. TaxID=49181 RepID=UPI001ACDAC12|nr:type II secretion system F family protein [Zoogloea sp.]MBN8284199.1 type II secretion system F family protein [Zoogloea sp.]